MRTVSFRLFLLLCLGCPCAVVHAVTINVPTDQSSIQAALNLALPGDVITVETGVYAEKIHFPRSGSPGLPITLMAKNGHTPVLDGIGVLGDNMVLIENRSYLRLIGFEIRNNLGVSDGSGIRIVGTGKDLVLRDNQIHEIRGTDAMGITVYGTVAAPIEQLIIDNNRIFDCDPARSEALTLNGNVRLFEITNNTVENVNSIGIDMIGGETSIQPNSTLVAREGIVRGNRVIHANSNYEGGLGAGIYVDGGHDIVIENNQVSRSDLGIEIGAENAGILTHTITVRNNVFISQRTGRLGFWWL